MMWVMAQNTNTPTLEATHREEPTDEELRLMSRRYALRLLGGAGLAVIAACATDGVVASTTASATGTSTSAAGTTATTTFGGAGTCVLIPEETEGP